MSRGGWIEVGILIAMMLMPSGVAVAKALKFTGIEGANGITTTENKAGVITAGQLQVAETDPNALLPERVGVYRFNRISCDYASVGLGTHPDASARRHGG